jgi:hypothetical protein
VVTQSSNNKVSTFFKSIVPDKNDMAVALHEGTFAFSTVQHHQSFKSVDCSSGLIKHSLNQNLPVQEQKWKL